MRVIGYEWRLREVMASAGMFSTTNLLPALAERGVKLSTSQVYRLVAEKPERLNMQVLVALMDIFDCTADDLVRRVELGTAAATGTGESQPQAPEPGSSRLRKTGLRPRRAEILPPDA